MKGDLVPQDVEAERSFLATLCATGMEQVALLPPKALELARMAENSERGHLGRMASYLEQGLV